MKRLLMIFSFLFLVVASVVATPDGKSISGDVTLNSFNIATSNPVTSTNWKNIPANTPAVLALPASANEDTQHPAIVYLLSSGGVSKADKRWQKKFLKNGYAVLQIDQYSNPECRISKSNVNPLFPNWGYKLWSANRPEFSKAKNFYTFGLLQPRGGGVPAASSPSTGPVSENNFTKYTCPENSVFLKAAYVPKNSLTAAHLLSFRERIAASILKKKGRNT